MPGAMTRSLLFVELMFFYESDQLAHLSPRRDADVQLNHIKKILKNEIHVTVNQPVNAR